jgi:hypothetical protein
MCEKMFEQSASIPSWRSAASMASATKLGRLRSTCSGSVSIVDAYGGGGHGHDLDLPSRVVP